ncbi:MAG TPA: DUF5335 family protein [Pyrinomonadaceae bacterium]|nr:DUF5335 family protein [Pyrinomonadaceae bacterium]
MPTQEIPRDEWKTFLDTFSRQHEGWLATLEIFATDIGAQWEARDLPLEGITATSKDNASQTIAISLRKSSEDHVTHTITDPTRVWLEQTSQGANAAIEIESADEVKTLLRFRSALPADMVDGVVLATKH